MYKKGIYKILANEPLTASEWRMVLEGDTEWIVRPGQFVNIALEGRYLRRPISVCDCDARTLTLIYKVVGGGTEQMSRMAAGAELDLLTGLGNGFDTSDDARRPLLVGGGVGAPPLYKLAKALLAEGKPVSVVLGFNTADEIFYADEFRALGCDVHVATADGSAGTKGFVTTAIAGDGIIDAPVLTRADIGIAMGAMGSDAAIEAADVVLMDDEPMQIAKAIHISRKCIGIVYQNIVFALAVKFACLVLVAIGAANMWAAIFADVGVMVLAVLNATRALYTKDLAKKNEQ